MQSFGSEWNMLSYIGGKMRLRVLLVLAVACLVLSASNVFAASDTCYTKPDTCYVCRALNQDNSFGDIIELDLGICDTVRIGCPICVNFSSFGVGDSFAVPIYIYNSNATSAVTLGFRHDGRGLRFGSNSVDGWDPEGTFLTALQLGGIQFAIDTIPSGAVKSDSGSALMGWIDTSDKRPIAKNTTSAARLLGTLYLVAEQLNRDTIRFDSTFYPPSGPFIFSSRDSVGGSFINKKLTPKFVMCKTFTPPCDIALPVNDVNAPALPQKFELGQNVPNPFNPNTAITFAVPRPSQVRIDVFNVMGQKVRTLADEYSKAGYKRVEWDGTDANGNSVASGVYLYRMTAGDFSETKKMLLLK
jgi:hypothetical protein